VIERLYQAKAQQILDFFPVLGIVGPRQVGKTTLAKSLYPHDKKIIYLDLQSPTDREKLENPESFFNQFDDHLIVIDEIQKNKRLFPILRASIDKNRKPGRFIILGPASPDLIRDSSESLAGRIAYLELSVLNVAEITDTYQTQKLWLEGGYPEPFLKPKMGSLWKKNYIQTYLERDLPLLGLGMNPIQTQRLWQIIAHLHGQLINKAEISKSLEINSKTIKKTLDFLEQAFIIRQLQPYHTNIKKRIVKSPKIYFRDTGILHYMHGIAKMEELFGHPKMGSSWEGFVIEQIYQLKNDQCNLFFFRTHNGAELDLIIEKNGKPSAGIEIKFGDKAGLSRGNTEAANELAVEKRFVIRQGGEDWKTKNDFTVTSLETFLKTHLPQL